jgi:hypothetical protein
MSDEHRRGLELQALQSEIKEFHAMFHRQQAEIMDLGLKVERLLFLFRRLAQCFGEKPS